MASRSDLGRPNITWLSAFIDAPSATHAAETEFWAALTESSVSASRGDDQQFATLDPPDGESVLRIQRLDNDSPRIHLDLHVDSIETARDAALTAGADVVMEDGYAVMRSPGGFVFCFVSGTGTERIGTPILDPGPHRVDQVSIDIPAEQFDEEVAFWNLVTGWGLGTTALPEYRSLEQPAHIPFRVLFQRLGDDDQRTEVEAHLDISSGNSAGAVRDRHVELGAEVISVTEHWTTLRDPAGLPYCVTHRTPR